ncbi:MAG: exonuclease SbcCD subunit D [Candidatus Aminicenantes bacterium]|nr:exonuclease SbcCD subunit D [Candidatus Aminicenantes bacterium]
MKIIHFSDTHLGYGEYAKVDALSGINQRELDVYAAFKQAVNLILKKTPDLVIHAGDLFDSPRPNNRAIHIALSELQRLSAKGIPTVIISGNHSTPRIAASGSIFEALTILPNIYPVYKKQYEKIIISDAAVHIVPHTSSDTELAAELEKVKPDPQVKFNILGLHAGLTWDNIYKMGEFSELIIPGKILSRFKGFDYIALGHWHRFLPLKGIPNAYYSGSIERFTFREEGYPKGVVFADLTKHTTEFIPLKVRGMIKLGPINCAKKDASQILDKINELKAQNKIDGQIVHLKLENLTRATYIQLDLREIRALLAEAFHLDIHPELVSESASGSSTDAAIGALPLEFERFLANSDLPDNDKKELTGLGMFYINQAQEREQL